MAADEGTLADLERDGMGARYHRSPGRACRSTRATGVRPTRLDRPAEYDRTRYARIREAQPMDEQGVREHAQALCDALVAGDIELATGAFSTELRQRLGEVLALLPLPSNEATVESVEHGGSGYNVVIRLAGEIDAVLIQTRWKERDGRPTVIEASHLSTTQTAAHDAEGAIEGEGGDR